MVIEYVIFQLSIWWLIYMTTLFYSIKFPFRAQIFTKGRKRKLLHSVSVAVGVFTPLVLILASVIGFVADKQEMPGNSTLSLPLARPRGYGYGMSGYPPILCTALDGKIIFYSSILPMGVVLGLGGSLLLTTLWLIHKVSVVVRVSVWRMCLVLTTNQKMVPKRDKDDAFRIIACCCGLK